MRNAGESDKGVYFPTAVSLKTFTDVIVPILTKKHFPATLIDVLATRIQPYIGGLGQILRALHDLAIMDKHRLIVPTVLATSAVVIGTEGMILPTFLQPAKAIKDGGVLIRLRADEFPHVKVGQEALVDLTIAFDKCGPLKGASVGAGLRRLLVATEQGVKLLRTCYPPRRRSLLSYASSDTPHSTSLPSTPIIDFYPLGHKRDFQRAYRAGLRDAINQLAQLTQAETDERKRLLLQERRAQFQTALHNNPVT
jgi:hypothetical protein